MESSKVFFFVAHMCLAEVFSKDLTLIPMSFWDPQGLIIPRYLGKFHHGVPWENMGIYVQ